MNGSAMGGAAVALVALVVIFLVCRELLCWYWKINRGIALLTEIRDLLASRAVAQPTPMSTSAPRREPLL